MLTFSSMALDGSLDFLARVNALRFAGVIEMRRVEVLDREHTNIFEQALVGVDEPEELLKWTRVRMRARVRNGRVSV
jgi:hypothetical protein